MAKKKPGNKKKNGGGRGGRGTPSAGASPGVPPKKQYCGRRELPPPPSELERDGAAERSSDDAGGVVDEVPLSPPPTGPGRGATAPATEDVAAVDPDHAPDDPVEAGTSDHAATEMEFDDKVVDSVPPPTERKGVETPATVEDTVDTAMEPAASAGAMSTDNNNDPSCASNNAAAIEVESDASVTEAMPPSNKGEGVGRSIAVELEDAVDSVIEPAVSTEGSLSDGNRNTSLTGTDSLTSEGATNAAGATASSHMRLADGADSDATERAMQVGSMQFGTVPIDENSDSQSQVESNDEENTPASGGNEPLTPPRLRSGEDSIAQGTKEMAPHSSQVEEGSPSNKGEDVGRPRATELEDPVDVGIEPAVSTEGSLGDGNHNTSLTGTDFNNADEAKAVADCLVDGAGAAEPATQVESMQLGTIPINENSAFQSKVESNDKKHTPTNGGNEPLTLPGLCSGDEGIAQATKEMTPYSSQTEVGIDLTEVDLDAPEKIEKPLPLVRAFSGARSGSIPPATHNMAFSFHDAHEIEAFVFLTASLRAALGDEANGASDATLGRYLRWKPDVQRAAERFRAYQQFRHDQHVCDDTPLLLSQDPKLTLLLQNGMVMAPEELVAKDGSGVVVIRAAKCDVSSAHGCTDRDASRAIFYVLQQVVERHTLDPLKGITLLLDLVGVARRNVPRRLATMLSKAVGCFPLRVQAIYVVATPWWFPNSHKMLCSSKMRTRIHALKEKKSLFEFIDKDRLLEEDGGIYHFDLQSWITSSVLAEL